MRTKSTEEEKREIERIELPPLTGGETGPRLVGGAARIVPRDWLKYRTSIHGGLIMVYPGRVWIKGNIRRRHPWPGDLVRVWCTPELAARPEHGAGGKHSLSTPRVWPECTAQGGVVSVLLNRRETIIEIEVYPGQVGWMRLLRLYGQLRNTKAPPWREGNPAGTYSPRA